MFFKSSGVLRYSGRNKLIVEVDQQIADYYRCLIPKWIPVQRSRWAAHVTVIREKEGLETEVPTNWDVWGKYEGQEIDFYYGNEVRYGEIYFWLDILSVEMEKIRDELGIVYLPPTPENKWRIPPKGFKKYFHMTIGNLKG